MKNRNKRTIKIILVTILSLAIIVCISIKVIKCLRYERMMRAWDSWYTFYSSICDCSDEFEGLIIYCNGSCIGKTSLVGADLLGETVTASIEISGVNSVKESNIDIRQINAYYDGSEEKLPHESYKMHVSMYNDESFFMYCWIDLKSNTVESVELLQDSIPDSIITEVVPEVKKVYVALNLESNNLTDDEVLILETIYPDAIIYANEEVVVGWGRK